MPDTEFFDTVKTGFVEMLDRIGVPIFFDGVEKRCIAGPLEFRSSIDLVGRIDEASIRVDMLAEDLDSFELEPQVTKCVIDDKTMTITVIDRDPQDPCIRFFAIADH